MNAFEAFQKEVVKISKSYDTEIGADIIMRGKESFVLSDLYTDYQSGRVGIEHVPSEGIVSTEWP